MELQVAPPDAGTSQLASQLRLAVVRLNRRMRSQRTDETLSLTQMSAIATLSSCGPMTPSALASSERVRPPSMTRVIASLEEGGWVSRRDHPSDGRQSIIELTAAGAQLLATELSLRERWLDKRLAELSSDDRAVLAKATQIIDRIASA